MLTHSVEIQAVIKEKGLVPESLKDSMVKQISWDDQWIGYDDAHTIAGKVAFANQRCLGGTMIWSVDFDSGSGSGDIPDAGEMSAGSKPSSEGSKSGGTGTGSGLVYVDSNIWAQAKPQVQCQPPCVLVLPPIPLPKPTTVSFPSFTTSYFVQSKRKEGDKTRTVLLTSKTIISLPPVTTTEIEVWAVTVLAAETKMASFMLHIALHRYHLQSHFLALPSSLRLPLLQSSTQRLQTRLSSLHLHIS